MLYMRVCPAIFMGCGRWLVENTICPCAEAGGGNIGAPGPPIGCIIGKEPPPIGCIMGPVPGGPADKKNANRKSSDVSMQTMPLTRGMEQHVLGLQRTVYFTKLYDIPAVF